jgi:hypothetical protein
MAQSIPIVTNDMVITLWTEGREARNHTNTLKAIAGDLYSYNLMIGRRTEGGQCIVVDKTAKGGCFHSQTTSCHIGQAKRAADMVMHPLVWEASPLSNDGDRAPF